MTEVAAAGRNPYPGLRPFEPEDADYFFGRDRQIDELAARLHDHRFVGVLGLSGSGKSSLVRAGLIPALQEGGLIGTGTRWRVAIMRPGAHPIDALADALRKALDPRATGAEHVQNLRSTYVEGLRASTRGLLKESHQGRQSHDNLLVVVDQFEELFRLRDEREASHFVDLLLATADEMSPEFRTYVVLTMRTDRLGECARFDGLPDALNRSQYLVPKLTPEQLAEAIEGPAALTDTVIDGGLVQELVVSASTGRDRLPLLQHLLTILWEGRQPGPDGSYAISRGQYTAARSPETALNDHADRVYNELPESLRELTSRIFRSLTGGDAGRDIRRPRRISQLAAETGGSADDVRVVVEHFFASHFLTSPDRSEEHHALEDWQADITHESLIRQWKKLAAWVDEEARDAEDFRFFANNAARGAGPLNGGPLDTAVAWLAKGYNSSWAARYGGDLAATRAYITSSAEVAKKEELKKERARYWAYVAAITGVLIAVGVGLLAWYAFNQRANARLAQLVAEDAQRKSDAARLTAQSALDQARQAVRDQLKSADPAVVLTGFAQLSKAHGESADAMVSAIPPETLRDNRWLGGVVEALNLSEAAGQPVGSELIAGIRSALRTAVGKARGIGIPSASEEEALNRRVLINAGRFRMGNDVEEGLPDEQHPHSVSLSRFRIQEHEVTNREYRRFDKSRPDNLLPVVGVSWFDAMAYAFWVGGTLPSEAQWEFAARGPGDRPRKYPWGSSEPDCKRAQHSGCDGELKPVKVGREMGKTPEGVYDLAGNVWEWCRDYYFEEYEDREVHNPTGPSIGFGRVLRGGSFFEPQPPDPRVNYLRGATRHLLTPDTRGIHIGFRVVVSGL